MIRCYQVTNFLPEELHITSALRAKSPCNLASQADFEISVFRESEFKYYASLIQLLKGDPNLSQEKCLWMLELLYPSDYL